jgi:hypothetical protein
MKNPFKTSIEKALDLKNVINDNKSDDEIIQAIKRSSKEIINQDLISYNNSRHPNLDYLSPNMNVYSDILSKVMHTRSEKVIHAVLDKTDKLNDKFFAFYKLLTRRENNRLSFQSQINITNHCLDLGLNLNETKKIKYFNYDNGANNPKADYYIANYLEEAFASCVKEEPILRLIHNTTIPIETGEVKNIIDSKRVEFFNFLLDRGLEKQEHNGELAEITIGLGSKELVEILCSLKGIDVEYIEKGIATWHKKNSQFNKGIDPRETFEYKNSIKVINYLAPYFELLQINKNIQAQEIEPKNKSKVNKI